MAVILSEVIVREADDNAVEGPRVTQPGGADSGSSPCTREHSENAFLRPSQHPQAGVLRLQDGFAFAKPSLRSG